MLSEKVFCFFFTCITLFDIIETVPFRNYMKFGRAGLGLLSHCQLIKPKRRNIQKWQSRAIEIEIVQIT